MSHPICNSIWFHFSSYFRQPSTLCNLQAVSSFVSFKKTHDYCSVHNVFMITFLFVTKASTHIPWSSSTAYFLSFMESLQRNVFPLRYSDILEARSNTLIKVFHFLPLVYLSRTFFSYYQFKQHKFCYLGRCVLLIACNLNTKKVISYKTLDTF